LAVRETSERNALDLAHPLAVARWGEIAREMQAENSQFVGAAISHRSMKVRTSFTILVSWCTIISRSDSGRAVLVGQASSLGCWVGSSSDPRSSS
jgi:hypothetical protein